MKNISYLLAILALLFQPAIGSLSSSFTHDVSGIRRAEALTIRYVDADASGANNGTSWADAFTSLQSALDATVNGDQVWVAAGIYKPTVEHCGSGERFKSFQLKNGVALYGGFDPTLGHTTWEYRDWALNLTILSGDIGIPGEVSDNSYHVICHPDGLSLDSSAILDGFTITGGYANGLSPHDNGGGMYNYHNNPTLSNLTFSSNSAVFTGGGMYNPLSSPALTHVTFSANTAGDSGGGLRNAYSSPILTDITFSGNTATDGGGMYSNTSDFNMNDVTFTGNTATSNGGGMYNEWSNPSLSDITFSDNSADYGGGLYQYSSNPTLTHVTFSGNEADYGGGMYNYSSSPRLTDVTFSDNTAVTAGGGMSNWTLSNPTLQGVTFAGNSAISSGGGMVNYMSSPILTDVYFYYNATNGPGGGIYNMTESSPRLTTVAFAGNTAASGGGMYNGYCNPSMNKVAFIANAAAYNGGGMDSYESSISLVDGIFYGNTASVGGGMINDGGTSSLTNITFSGNTSDYGGGMVNYQGSVILVNVTFSGNQAKQSGGGIFNSDSSSTLTNTILWGNIPNQIFSELSTTVVTYSEIQGGYSGAGNINLAPQFIRNPSPGGDGTWGTADDDYGDLRLQPTSPAIDAGNNDAVTTGITTDLSGAPRFVDIPGVADTGLGAPPVVDIGAYEVQITVFLPFVLVVK